MKKKITPRAQKLIDAFEKAAGEHRWQQDQGWSDSTIVAAADARNATKAALENYILKLQTTRTK